MATGVFLGGRPHPSIPLAANEPTEEGDELVGTSGPDLILGEGGNDTIDGLGAGDTLLGGAGDDSVFGGTGDDTLLGEQGEDDLRGLAGDDTLYGGEAADILSGDAGDDWLDGNGGADIMEGGAGNDIFVVDAAGDRISEDPGAREGGIDTVRSSVTFRLPDNVERLILTGDRAINGTGTDRRDLIIGNDARNVLSGGDGPDRLFGGNGTDVLSGGKGDDEMRGGAGSDRYIVHDADDEVIEARLEGTDTVQSAADRFKLPLNVENLTLLSGGVIGIGNVHANELRGNSAANTLDGGGEDDSILGGSGDDRLLGRAGDDHIDGERGNDAIDGGEGSDTLEGGDGNDKVDGGEGRDTLHGDAAEDEPLDRVGGNDTIYGGNGFDDMFGGAGDDTLFGGVSVDVLNGGAGADTLDGGAGTDFASYKDGPRVLVDLARGFAESDGDRDRLIGIEAIEGSQFSDRMVGNGDSNILNGFDGNDVLIGGIGGGGTTRVRGDGTLSSGLGGPSGFGENSLAPGDDGSSAAIDIRPVFRDGLDFFGRIYTSIYVNNNGNITFASPQSTFTPFVITGQTSNPIIAPFFADVDTRRPSAGSEPQPGAADDLTWWDLDSRNKVLTVTWDNVGYFREHTSKLNAFQLELYDRGGGDFDIAFRFQKITWTTGDASGGQNGLGGTVARSGWSSGNGLEFFELPASGNQADMLDLERDRGNTGATGLWVFEVRNGAIVGDPDELAGGDGDDTLQGGLGNDILWGGNGADRFDYGNRNERGDQIRDFDPNADIIDLSRVVVGYTAGSDPNQFLRITTVEVNEIGGPRIDSVLQLDFDGGANNFIDFLTLTDRAGLTVSGLVASGAIDLTA